MKTVILQIFVAIWHIIQTYAEDPCSSNTEISDLLKRRPSYKQDVMPLCDNHLTTGWYRAGYLKMPTSPPALGFCGTNYPVWLNGDHPSTNEMKNVTVCTVGTANPCSQEIDISVKNCSSYMVYQLPHINCCNSAYCFESDQKCTLDVPKDPTVSYYNLSWDRANSGVISQYAPSVNLICRFTPLKDDLLFYDISWYVDDLEVVKGQTVTSHTLDRALLSAFDILKNNKTAGSMIHCIIGSKLTESGVPCTATASPLFFAGIKILTPQLYIKKGSSTDLKMQLTIPYADDSFLIDGRDYPTIDLVVYINISTILNPLLACGREYLFYKHDWFMICEVRIKGYTFKERSNYGTDVWKQIYSMSIHNYDDGDVAMSDRVVSLQLTTGLTYGSGSRLFSDIKLQDIPVYIYSDQAPPKPTVPSTTVPTSDDCAAVNSATITPSTPTSPATVESAIILNKTKCKKSKRSYEIFFRRVHILSKLVHV